MNRSIKILVVTIFVLTAGCESKQEEVRSPVKAEAEVKPTDPKPEAKPKEAEAVKLEGAVYGAGVSLSKTISVSELLATPDLFAGQTVRIEGVVSGVCPKRGCWIDIAGDTPGQKVRFKVRDGVMVFPMEENGKYAVAQGVVRKMPMTLEQSKNYAAYQAREYGADMDPDKITEPITLIRLDGTGAVVRNAP
jgi:hypothetical protein